MQPLKHQIEKSKDCLEIINNIGMCYLQGLPRSGKTLTSILVAEQLEDVKNILVLTKKNAISGWEKFNKLMTKTYKITNYEQIGKLNKEDYDFVIIDESHNLSAFPKPSGRTKLIKDLAYDKKVILLSGTAIVESPSGIYHQCYITKYTPFSEFKSFYQFHKKYGLPYEKFIAGRNLKFYDKCKPEIIEEINKFSVYMTQEDAGINVNAEDEIHYIDLEERTKKIYNHLQKKKVVSVYDVNGKIIKIVCDSTMKLRTVLHSLEGGTVKVDDKYYEIGNLEKINYIKKHFGDDFDISIMSHFVHERELLKKHFKKAQIYSSNANAEGVDLSHSRHFIIFSSDYSGAKFIQRRERIININGSKTNRVIFLLVRNAISHQVYQATSKKMDFNNSLYKKIDI